MLSFRKLLFTWLIFFSILSFTLSWIFILVVFHYDVRIIREHEFGTGVIFISILTLLCVGGSRYLSGLIIRPIKQFAMHIEQIRKSDFTKVNTSKKIVTLFPEINELYIELYKLVEKSVSQERESNFSEKNLRYNEIKYREHVENSPQCVFETDQAGKFTFVNNKLIELFGYKTEEFHEKNFGILDILVADTSERVMIADQDALQADMMGIRSDNSLFPVIVCISNIYKNNNIKGMRGIIIDNTDRIKYIEELKEARLKAEQSDKLKSAFLANMSHEIRTPMNAILGFANLLAVPGNEEETKSEYLRHIINSGETLLKLIDDVIDIAKIEAGELKISLGEFDLNDLMFDVHSYFAQLKSKKNSIELKMHTDVRNGSFSVFTDAVRLRQILNNLIGNAYKFTHSGFIEFGYTVFGSTIQFYVKDTGIGIPTNMQRIIFKRFRQAEQSNERMYGGAGLGLTITKSLVKLLGGRIWVHSEEGVGSTFYFTICNEKKESNNSLQDKLNMGILVN